MFRQIVISIIIIILALILANILVNSRSEPEEKPKDETTPLVQVAPIKILNGNVLVNGSGNVRARQEVSFAAEVSGKLIYVNPRLIEGQRISKGEVLFRIDTANFRSALDAARADVASQNVAVDQAREEVALAKAELDRFNQRRDIISSAITDTTTQILPPDALQNTAAGNSIALQSSNVTPNNLATRQPQLDSARAALRRAKAQLADAQTALSRTVVRAPFTGVVRSKSIALGSFVQPGQALGSIVGTGEYEAVISLSETEAALVDGLWAAGKTRPQASIFLNYGGTRYRWQAYVDRASSILNPQTRTIDIFLRIPRPINGGAIAANSDGGQNGEAIGSLNAPPLFIGSFVDAEISGKNIGDYAELPLTALRPENKIWLVEDGKLRIIDANIIQRLDKSVLITTDNLGPDAVAIIGNLKTATEGEKVRISKSRSAKPPSEKPKQANQPEGATDKSSAAKKAAPES